MSFISLKCLICPISEVFRLVGVLISKVSIEDLATISSYLDKTGQVHQNN